MSLWRSMEGVVRIRLISASAEYLLLKIVNAGIPLENIVFVDDLTVETDVERRYYKQIYKLVDQVGDSLELLKRSGLYWRLTSLGKRPLLLTFLAIYVAAIALIPTRIFFVSVDGNNAVPKETIISSAETAGVRFGVPKRMLRNEKVKNALISAIPELQWAGVNTRGCVATISVKERSQGPKVDGSGGVSSIVAKCDGVVQNVTVTKGNVLCKVGDVVKRGQILVSGYTDCGIQIKATNAEGEIYAQTIHPIYAVSPLKRQYRRVELNQKKRCSFVFGKKLIKLYKDSGISDVTCVKMYKRMILTLPGGFQLPVALIVETEIGYTTQTAVVPCERVEQWICDQSLQYQIDKMLAGEVLSGSTQIESSNDLLSMVGQYNCYEMIGQRYNEEIIDGNE